MKADQHLPPRTCQICGSGHVKHLRPASFVRPALTDFIRNERGSWQEEGWICTEDLNHLRQRYIEHLLKDEKGELTKIEEEVLESLRTNEILARDLDAEIDAQRTRGERVADRMADFGGSWRFLAFFGASIVVWMLLNSLLLIHRPFDPYPYILLNLVLSCLAAVQAPIIMMSQNRQAVRDRLRATHDYQINLKAELEIRNLHQKVDHLLSHQWERLVEIQEIQMELLHEIQKRK